MTRYAPTPAGRAAAQAAMNATGTTMGPRRPAVVRPGVPSGPKMPIRGSGPNDGGPLPRPGLPSGPKTMTAVDMPIRRMKHGGKVKSKAMRGGGLARKGVGMALAKGGLAKRAGGIAKRGVGRGKMC